MCIPLVNLGMTASHHLLLHVGTFADQCCNPFSACHFDFPLVDCRAANNGENLDQFNHFWNGVAMALFIGAPLLMSSVQSMVSIIRGRLFSETHSSGQPVVSLVR